VDTAISLGEQPERGRMVPEQDDLAVREILREPTASSMRLFASRTLYSSCGFGMELAADLRFQKSDQAMELTASRRTIQSSDD
jgi:hypothetical protein